MNYLFKAKTTVKDEPHHEFNNVWVAGDLIKSSGKSYIHPQGNVVDVKGEIGKMIIMHEVQPMTICQYSGLNDSKGEMIFEGDILNFDNALCSAHHRSWNGIVILDVTAPHGDRWGHMIAPLEADTHCNNDILSWQRKIGGVVCLIKGNVFDEQERVRYMLRRRAYEHLSNQKPMPKELFNYLCEGIWKNE